MKTDQQRWWYYFIYLEKAHDAGRTGNWLNTYQFDFFSETLLSEDDFNMVSPSTLQQYLSRSGFSRILSEQAAFRARDI